MQLTGGGAGQLPGHRNRQHSAQHSASLQYLGPTPASKDLISAPAAAPAACAGKKTQAHNPCYIDAEHQVRSPKGRNIHAT
jgi:hypothetical protein